MKTNFTDFHRGQFLALRCCFLDLTSFYHYVFGFLGQNLGLGAKKRPFWAKIGYMQKWIFLKTPSLIWLKLHQNDPQGPLLMIIYCFFISPSKNFHDGRFCDFGPSQSPTGIQEATYQMLPCKALNDPKTLPIGIIHI